MYLLVCKYGYGTEYSNAMATYILHFVILVIANVVRTNNNQCHSGFHQVDNMCIVIVDAAKSKKGAEEGCVALGAHLLTIRSSKMQHQVYTLLKKLKFPDNIWRIDGHRDKNNKTDFVDWSDKSMKYFNWGSRQPDNIRETCITLVMGYKWKIRWDGKWNDCYCSHKRGYICGKKMSYRDYPEHMTVSISSVNNDTNSVPFGDEFHIICTTSRYYMVNQTKISLYIDTLMVNETEESPNFGEDLRTTSITRKAQMNTKTTMYIKCTHSSGNKKISETRKIYSSYPPENVTVSIKPNNSRDTVSKGANFEVVCATSPYYLPNQKIESYVFVDKKYKKAETSTNCEDRLCTTSTTLKTNMDKKMKTFKCYIIFYNTDNKRKQITSPRREIHASFGGAWNSWSPWTKCSVTCESSEVRRRQRVCNNPSPSGGGADCPGRGTDVLPCNAKDCPDPSYATDPTWGEWEAWSKCTQTCGGEMRRTRTCKPASEKCVGKANDVLACTTPKCPGKNKKSMQKSINIRVKTQYSKYVYEISVSTKGGYAELRRKICADVKMVTNLSILPIDIEKSNIIYFVKLPNIIIHSDRDVQRLKNNDRILVASRYSNAKKPRD